MSKDEREELIDMLTAALPCVEDAGDDVCFTKEARAKLKELAKRMRAAIEATP